MLASTPFAQAQSLRGFGGQGNLSGYGFGGQRGNSSQNQYQSLFNYGNYTVANGWSYGYYGPGSVGLYNNRPTGTPVNRNQPVAQPAAPYLTTQTIEPGDGYRYPVYFNPATGGYFYHPVPR